MAIRINVSLAEKTLRVIDRYARPGERSRFIEEAVHHYVASTSRQQLRERLKQGALKRAERDRGLAEEWFSLEHDTWPDDQPRKRRK